MWLRIWHRFIAFGAMSRQAIGLRQGRRTRAPVVPCHCGRELGLSPPCAPRQQSNGEFRAVAVAPRPRMRNRPRCAASAGAGHDHLLMRPHRRRVVAIRLVAAGLVVACPDLPSLTAFSADAWPAVCPVNVPMMAITGASTPATEASGTARTVIVSATIAAARPRTYTSAGSGLSAEADHNLVGDNT